MKLNRNNIIYIVIVVVLIVVALIIINPFKKDSKNSSKNGKNGNDIKTQLVEMGKKYYEKTFYPLLDGNFEILDLYKDKGLSNTLTSISNVVPINNELKQELADKKCDYEKTSIVIYPKEPFGKTDYTVDVSLSCEK